MSKKRSFLYLLLPACIICGCTTTDHSAGIDIDTINESVDPVSRYSGEWGKIQSQGDNCVELSGEYTIVPTVSINNTDNISGVSLSSLLNLQSHNWPLKHPLTKDKYARIEYHNHNSPIDFIFYVETVPFQSKLNNYQCTNGWTRVLYKEDSPGEAVWINSISDVYLTKTLGGDLIVFHRAWSKTTALFGLNKHEKSQEQWYLFKPHGEQ